MPLFQAQMLPYVKENGITILAEPPDKRAIIE
jgi:hypothetical protein